MLRARWLRTAALPVTLSLTATGLVLASGPGPVGATENDPSFPALERLEGEEPQVVEIELHDTDELDRLVETGVDLDHGVEQHDHGLAVRAVVTDNEIAALEARGFEFGEVLYTSEDSNAAIAEREQTLASQNASAQRMARAADDPTNPDVSDVRIIRADYYTSFGQGILSVEAKWADGLASATPLTVERDAGAGTAFGAGGTQNISRFVDAGAYLYHRGASAVESRPDRVRITSPTGDVAIAEVRDWLPTDEDDPFKGDGYQQDFVTKYLDPTELYDRIKQIHAQYPEITELVELPNKSNGYRRKAQALLDPPGNRLIVASGAAEGQYSYVPSTTLGTPVAAGTPTQGLETVTAAANPAWPNATPQQGCGPLTGFTPGAVALVDRGECGFNDKAATARDAGASAVIVVNNVAGAPSAPGGTLAGLTIPVVMISQADGAALRAAAPTRGRLVPGSPTPAAASRVGVDSLAWGHEGGNDITIKVSDPREASADLRVVVTNKLIEVFAATDQNGAITSTAADVVTALDASPRASALVDAYTYRGNAGTGVVAPTQAVALSDNLNAPAHVSRDPHPVYALRIGKHLDGSKPGVLLYAQEHAREWVPPLVMVETAERLARNYETHAPTKDMIDNTEVIIAPSINPDGGHYSFYDFASQRRNMTRHCAEGGNYDAAARNSWGVDLNRNHSAYSLFDGYSGASTSCTSDTYAGPSEVSEPEAQNLAWLADQHPNLKFSVNTHSSGNYFMWAPGAYKLPGRELAPRASLAEEDFFWESSRRILTSIKRYRGMSVTPARTGVTADVIYSAAGNSADMLWYEHGVYAWSFEVGTQFQPPFAANTESATPASAHSETMEYANGMVEIVRLAREHAQDTEAPTSAVKVTRSATEGKVNLEFSADEAAQIRYTVDGSRPTAESTSYESTDIREGGARIQVDEGARVYWYATDIAGNVEAGYDPDDADDRRYRKWIAEVDWEPSTAESSVALTSSAARVRAGSAVTLRAQVDAENEFELPATGTVEFKQGARTLATAELDAEGRASAQLDPFTTVGARSITAVYSGDDLTASSTSAAVSVTVVKATSTVVGAQQSPARIRVRSSDPALTRGKVAVRISVPGLEARGRVEVLHGSTVLGRGWADSNGRVTVQLRPFSTPGTRTVRVVYRGTAHINASQRTMQLRVI